MFSKFCSILILSCSLTLWWGSGGGGGSGDGGGGGGGGFWWLPCLTQLFSCVGVGVVVEVVVGLWQQWNKIQTWQNAKVSKYKH